MLHENSPFCMVHSRLLEQIITCICTLWFSCIVVKATCISPSVSTTQHQFNGILFFLGTIAGFALVFV